MSITPLFSFVDLVVAQSITQNKVSIYLYATFMEQQPHNTHGWVLFPGLLAVTAVRWLRLPIEEKQTQAQ